MYKQFQSARLIALGQSRPLVIRTLSFLLLINLFLSANSQDVITLKNGDEIKAKVLEVEAQLIKYKKAENLNGPTYSLAITEIFMIHYENGTKEVFNNLTTSPTQPIQSGQLPTKAKSDSAKVPSPIKSYRKDIVGGAVMTGIGAPLLPVGLTFTLVGVNLNNAYDPYAANPTGPLGEPYLMAGAVLLGVGTALTIAGPIVLSRGTHNRKLSRQPRAILNFTPKDCHDFDKHFQATNYQKLGGISITF